VSATTMTIELAGHQGPIALPLWDLGHRGDIVLRPGGAHLPREDSGVAEGEEGVVMAEEGATTLHGRALGHRGAAAHRHTIRGPRQGLPRDEETVAGSGGVIRQTGAAATEEEAGEVPVIAPIPATAGAGAGVQEWEVADEQNPYSRVFTAGGFRNVTVWDAPSLKDRCSLQYRHV
jgi:hypothetical protein